MQGLAAAWIRSEPLPKDCSGRSNGKVQRARAAFHPNTALGGKHVPLVTSPPSRALQTEPRLLSGRAPRAPTQLKESEGVLDT